MSEAGLARAVASKPAELASEGKALALIWDPGAVAGFRSHAHSTALHGPAF